MMTIKFYPLSNLALLTLVLANSVTAVASVGQGSSQVGRVLQSTAVPRVEFNVPTANNPNITFFNFPYTVKAPDAGGLVLNVPANVSEPIYNLSLSLPGSTGYGNNLGTIVPPQNLKEAQFRFDDNCLLPIVVFVANNSTLGYQMAIDSSKSSTSLKILNSKILGPLGTANTTVRNISYADLSRQKARDQKLFNVTYQITNQSVLNTSYFQVYCPMKADDATIITFTANFSNAYIGPAPANTTTTVLGPSDPNNTGLIIALVVGLGVPVFLLLCLLVWFIFCRSKKQYVPKPKEDDVVLPPADLGNGAEPVETGNHARIGAGGNQVAPFNIGGNHNEGENLVPRDYGYRQDVAFGEHPEAQAVREPHAQS